MPLHSILSSFQQPGALSELFDKLPDIKNVLASIVAIVVLRLAVWFIQRLRALPGVPGPPLESFLCGHTLQIRTSPVGKYFKPWMKEYGHVYKTYGALCRPILCITDSKAISHIVANNLIYHKDDEEKAMTQTWFGKGLITSEGSEHKRMRKMLGVAFTPQAVREVSNVLYDLAERLKTQWEDAIDRSDKSSTTVNVITLIHQATLDAISKTAFMYDCQAHSGVVPDLLKNLFTIPILDRNTVLMRYLITKFPIILLLPTRMHRFAKRIRKELGGIAKDAWDGVKTSSDMHAKLLDALVSHSISEGVVVDKEETVVFITEMLFAGSETTANVLTEGLYELSTHKNVQKRLRDELVQFDLSHGRMPNYDEIMNPTTLPYFDAVIREILRLKHVQNHLNRKVVQTDVIPFKDPIKGTNIRHLKVTPGLRIELLVRDGINVAENIWGPDGREFRPERWLEKLPEAVSEIHAQGNIYTFGDGARVCIGRQFALAELRILLSTVIRHFTFDNNGIVSDSYFAGGDTIRPYVRGKESEGAQMPLKIEKYEVPLDAEKAF